jgi:hypothetical protein
MKEYKYKAVAALSALHEKHLLSFIQTWKEAEKKKIKLPVTSDPDYNSIYTLLYHVLSSSRGYITWICSNLNLNDPEIPQVPDVENIAEDIDGYVKILIDKWNIPLMNIEESEFSLVFKSKQGVDYSIEAMLEHAVMHPIRHEYQLQNLIKNKANL